MTQRDALKLISAKTLHADAVQWAMDKMDPSLGLLLRRPGSGNYRDRARHLEAVVALYRQLAASALDE